MDGYASNLFTHCCCYTALCCRNMPPVNDPFSRGWAFGLLPVFCYDNALLWYFKLLTKIISLVLSRPHSRCTMEWKRVSVEEAVIVTAQAKAVAVDTERAKQEHDELKLQWKKEMITCGY